MFLIVQVLESNFNESYLKKVINFIKKHGDIKDVKALGSLIITPLATDQKIFLDSVTEHHMVAHTQIVVSQSHSHTEYKADQYWSKGKLEGLLTKNPEDRVWLGDKIIAVDASSPKSLAQSLRSQYD